LVHVWSTSHRNLTVRNGLQRSPAVGHSRRLQARSWGNRPGGRTLIRMRSQVQVLAGPPTIVAGQSAVGSKPGTLAASLGRAGAARPSRRQAHRPLRARPPRRQAPRPPRTVVAHPSRGGQPRGRCGLLPCPRAAAGDGRSARRPGLPGRPASSAAAARTRPGPGPPPTAPPTLGDLGGVARVRAGSAVDPSRSTTRQPTGTWTRSRGAGGCVASACPQPPPPDGRPDGRVRTDGGGHQRAGHRTGWTPDGPDTGRPDSRAPDDENRMGGYRMLDADRRPTPWLASWHGRARRRCLTAGCPLDARLGRGVWASNNQDRSAARTRGHHAPRDGLDHRHDRQLLGRFAGQAAPRRTAVLRRLRVERRAGGARSSVMASAYADGCCRSTCDAGYALEYGCRLG
jgi:hypothetical protein